MTKKDILKLYPDFKFEELNKSENKILTNLDSGINKILNELEKNFDSEEAVHLFLKNIISLCEIGIHINYGIYDFYNKSMSVRMKKKNSRRINLYTKCYQLYLYAKGNIVDIIKNQSKEVIESLKKQVIPKILKEKLTDDDAIRYGNELIEEIFGENA